MRHVYGLALVVSVTALGVRLGAREHFKPITIAVVQPGSDGFIDPKDRDSTHDIEAELKRDDLFLVVSITKPHRLTITATRSVRQTEDLLKTYYESLNTLIQLEPQTSEERPYSLPILKVGGYGGWRYAARLVVKDLHAWIVANATRLGLESR